MTQHPLHILWKRGKRRGRGREREREGEGGRETGDKGEALKLRHTEAILQHTSTLDKSAVVVDTLLHSLILPTVVDDELFVAATAAMTHCW